MNHLVQIIALGTLLLFADLWAAEENSGFLSDYSVLVRTSDDGNVLLFLKDGAVERFAEYDSMIVDEPELFIDPESKYKGMKASTMTELAKGIRASITEGLGETFGITETPGPKVLYLRVAASRLFVMKEKRKLLGYTPIGAVAGGIKGAVSDFVDKNTLVEMTLEVELQDSESGEVLGAAIMSRGQRKDRELDLEEEPADWERLDFAFHALGQRLGCRLNNTRVAEAERSDCLQIPLVPPEED